MVIYKLFTNADQNLEIVIIGRIKWWKVDDLDE